MPFTVFIEVSKSFETSASPDTVFELLADVPRSASYFPDVERLEPIGPHAYRWIMRRISLGDHPLQQIIYAYTNNSCDRKSLSVSWVSIEGEGNATIDGGWKLEPASSGTKVELHSNGSINVNLPAFLQCVVSPLIKFVVLQKIDRYLHILQDVFEG